MFAGRRLWGWGRRQVWGWGWGDGVGGVQGRACVRIHVHTYSYINNVQHVLRQSDPPNKVLVIPMRKLKHILNLVLNDIIAPSHTSRSHVPFCACGNVRLALTASGYPPASTTFSAIRRLPCIPSFSTNFLPLPFPDSYPPFYRTSPKSTEVPV